MDWWKLRSHIAVGLLWGGRLLIAKGVVDNVRGQLCTTYFMLGAKRQSRAAQTVVSSMKSGGLAHYEANQAQCRCDQRCLRCNRRLQPSVLRCLQCDPPLLLLLLLLILNRPVRGQQ
eukprot:5561723-Amphidinium_carterae.1